MNTLVQQYDFGDHYPPRRFPAAGAVERSIGAGALTTQHEMLTIARGLVSRGFSVFPLDHPDDSWVTDPDQIGKTPAIKWKAYQERRPTDAELVEWFGNGRKRNAAMVTGAISNLIIIDGDSEQGLAWMRAHLPETPLRTRTAKGEHWGYRHPGVPIKNKVRIRTGDPAIKIDVRGDGGFVVAPGSLHHTRVFYTPVGTWPQESHLPTFDPAWLEADTPNPSRPEPLPPSIPRGEQHMALFREGCRLRRLGWEQPEIADALWSLHRNRSEGPDVQHEREDVEKIAASICSQYEAGRTTESGSVSVEDFYAYMPTHSYLFVPSREFWPARSVNARIFPIPTGQQIDEGEPQTIPASVWLDRHRHVEQMTWAPGQSLLIPDRLVSDGGWIERVGCSCINLYRGPTITPGDPAQAEPWLALVRAVYPQHVDHIVAWFAHRVQRPHEKINHALVLGGVPGIGKDTIMEPVKAAIGPWNFAEISPSHLLGRFNGFVKSVILRISEARDLGEMNRYDFYEHLKVYAAAPPDVLRVDEKNIREHAVFNVCGVVITTNHETDGIYLPPDDRRHYVVWSELTPADFPEGYWKRIYDWYAGGGDRHVAAYLAAHDLSTFDPKAPPPKTESFWAIVDANRPSEDAELADLIEECNNPKAITLDLLIQACPIAMNNLRLWLEDRKNRRQIPHRMKAINYVPFRNVAATDGLWKIDRRRQVVYVREELSVGERVEAIKGLGRPGREVSELLAQVKLP